MWIDWDVAAATSIVLAVAVLLWRNARAGWAIGLRATARELSLVLALYSVWQWAHEQAVTEVAGAREHALWLYDLQHSLHIPDEIALQKAVLPHGWLAQTLNGYYALVHVPALICLLVWLFFGHRDRYPWVRNTLALLTAGCLFLQTIPMAPPRMFPELGFVDTGLLYGQSVYGRGGSGISNQLAAMPSVHVGWALLVGLAAAVIGSSRWRWVVLLHPILTVVAVTATANHWYGDGIVAGAILVVALAIVAAADRIAACWRDRVGEAHRPGESMRITSVTPAPTQSPS
ncbi:MAG: phosphatase PAP2 family protein [Acidimicrobiales bacterium]